MQEEWHLLEELDLSFNFLGFEFFQDPLVVFAADDGEAAVSGCLDGGCSRLVVQESQFTEALSLLEGDNFHKPFEFFVLL